MVSAQRFFGATENRDFSDTTLTIGLALTVVGLAFFSTAAAAFWTPGQRRKVRILERVLHLQTGATSIMLAVFAVVSVLLTAGATGEAAAAGF